MVGTIGRIPYIATTCHVEGGGCIVSSSVATNLLDSDKHMTLQEAPFPFEKVEGLSCLVLLVLEALFDVKCVR